VLVLKVVTTTSRRGIWHRLTAPCKVALLAEPVSGPRALCVLLFKLNTM
jgi:hypothetical protein